jgi:hypothetical protein
LVVPVGVGTERLNLSEARAAMRSAPSTRGRRVTTPGGPRALRRRRR